MTLMILSFLLAAQISIPVTVTAPPIVKRSPGAIPYFTLASHTPLYFSVQSSMGPINGHIMVEKIECKGIDNWGNFLLKAEIDPQSITVGDLLFDQLLRKELFKGDKAHIYMSSSKRSVISSESTRNFEKSPFFKIKEQDAHPSNAQSLHSLNSTSKATHITQKMSHTMGLFLDQKRHGKYLELPFYYEEITKNKGKLSILSSLQWEQLGIGRIPHPFIQLTGPIYFSLQAEISR